MVKPIVKLDVDVINSKTQIGIDKYKDCLWDLTTSTDIIIPDVAFEHVYIKIKHLKIDCLLDKKLNSDVDNVVVELVDLLPEKNINITEVIQKVGVRRLVLKFIVKSHEQLLDFKNGQFTIINDVEIDNLAIDLYFDYESRSITQELIDLLTYYKKVKHFSIYFTHMTNTGLLIPARILNFKRYHQHMWALDDYHSSFHITNVVTKNYLGLGKKTTSRMRNDFYECHLSKDKTHWVLKKMSFCPGFVKFNDHIDRLSFYYKLTAKELDQYLQIDDYDRMFEKYEGDLYLIHNMLIGKLMERL